MKDLTEEEPLRYYVLKGLYTGILLCLVLIGIMALLIKYGIMDAKVLCP